MLRTRRQIPKQAAPVASAEARAAEPVSPASTAAASPTSSTKETPRKLGVRFCHEEETLDGVRFCFEVAAAATAATTPSKRASRMFRTRLNRSKGTASPTSTASTEASPSASLGSSFSEDLDEPPEAEREDKFLNTFSTARKAVDAFPRKAMLEVMRDLLYVYSSARFQGRLLEIGALDDKPFPSAGIAELLHTSHRGVLKEHRLPEGEKGEIALVYLVSRFSTLSDPEGAALVHRIDNALFGPWSRTSNTKHHLDKRAVVDAVRSQVRAFASEAFQSKLASLLQGVKSSDSKEPEMHTDGVPMHIFDHALSEQKPILDRFALPPNETGLVLLNFSAAAYMGDPIVAKGVSIASSLMGMCETAIASFRERSIANALTDTDIDAATIASVGKHFGSS